VCVWHHHQKAFNLRDLLDPAGNLTLASRANIIHTLNILNRRLRSDSTRSWWSFSHFCLQAGSRLVRERRAEKLNSYCDWDNCFPREGYPSCYWSPKSRYVACFVSLEVERNLSLSLQAPHTSVILVFFLSFLAFFMAHLICFYFPIFIHSFVHPPFISWNEATTINILHWVVSDLCFLHQNPWAGIKKIESLRCWIHALVASPLDMHNYWSLGVV
jgi:hypothetical protein